MSSPFPCSHFLAIRDVVPSSTRGCEECVQLGGPWVQLRICLTCGHVGCCDDSPLRRPTSTAHDPVPGPTPRHHIAPPALR
jgi:hypothetical protein